MRSLQDTLTGAGKAPLTSTFPDGSRLLMLPGNGRLLGLYPPDSDENVLWTHPALTTAAAAAAWFACPGWPNPGGDRTWLGPEIETFIGDLSRPAETYAVQPALDPGNWKLTASATTKVVLTNETRVQLHRAKRHVGVRLVRTFTPAANPLPGASPARAGLRYAGYSLVTALELEPQPDDVLVRLGIWNLLQLPQPGAMLIPTREPIRPRCFFGALAADELIVAPRLVRWNMGAPGEDTKIGIQAHPLADRAGHLRETTTPGVWDLVIRQFAVDTAGPYVDALWEPPHEAGWTFQACCVRAGTACFNELEYHVPAASTTTGANVSRDASRCWAFRGPIDGVAEAARLLLGGAAEASVLTAAR